MHVRRVNNKINHLHEGSLCLACKDNISSFKELLKNDILFTVHHTNIQSLAIEIFKVTENLWNTIMNDVLQTRTLTYKLKSQICFLKSFVNTNCFVLNSLRHFASKVWNIVLSDDKNVSNLHIFTNKKRKRKPTACQCGLVDLSCLGFVNLAYIRFN